MLLSEIFLCNPFVHRLAAFGLALTLSQVSMASAPPAALAKPRIAQPVPPPPITAWRPPSLQVQGAEQPVRLQSLQIDVEVSGGVAETRVVMEFFNPNNRVLEGELQFPLTSGQAVTGFGLDVNGKLRDAVPVEKARAQEIFEDIARQGVDPGVLQSTLGNNYKLRIYPLNPRASRTVALRISEAAGTSLQVPLAYAQSVKDFALTVRYPAVSSAPRLQSNPLLNLRFVADPKGGFSARASGTDLTLPRTALQVFSPAEGKELITTEMREGEEYFTLRLPVAVDTQPRKLPQRMMLVWDASASGASRAHDKEFTLLEAYFQRASNQEVSLVTVADTASAAQFFTIRGGDWSSLKRALQAVVYDGASNLGAVVHDGRAQEALWFSDGLSNYGANAWSMNFPVPVYAINSANSSNDAGLRALAKSSGGRLIDLTALNLAQASKLLLSRSNQLGQISALGAREVIAVAGSAESGLLQLAGILTAGQADITLKFALANGNSSTRTVRINSGQNPSRLAATWWAQNRLAELAADPRLHKTQIRNLGKRFGLVTPETSLLVLERIEDYVRHAIVPPAELRPVYDNLLARTTQQKKQADTQRMENLVRRFEARAAWWERDFPKGNQLKIAQKAKTLNGYRDQIDGTLSRTEEDERAPRPRAAIPASAPVAPQPMPLEVISEVKNDSRSSAKALPSVADQSKRGEAAGRLSYKSEAAADKNSISIQIKPAVTNVPYLKRLQAAPAEQWQGIYFDERRDFTRSVSFYLDVAEFFFEKGQNAIALRVLSNLAELDLENRQILRLLAYRLTQADRVTLALPIFERVLDLAPNEPQSFRDLGLALAQAGQSQRAVERLYEVVTGQWSDRFPDIDLIALTELNTVVDKARRAGKAVDTRSIDSRLLRNLPLDLRVVLAWDADNTDVDLHVIDPNGEEVFYGHQQSYQGGTITRDATGGYGPEEFALKVAKPGKYRVEANFYGHRQQVLINSTGLMLWLSSGFGKATQVDQRTTRRLKSTGGERVVIGEFEVK